MKRMVCAFAILMLLGFGFAADAQSVVHYPVSAMTISPDGTLMAVAGRVVGGQDTRDGNEYPIDLVDLVKGTMIKTLGDIWPPPDTLALNYDNTILAFRSVEGSAKLIDVATGTELYDFFGLSGVEPIGPAWSPVNNQVAAGIFNRINIIDGATLKPVGGIVASGDAIFTALAWSADGTRIATSTGDHHIQIWDTRSANPTLVTSLPGGGGSSIAWSPNGSFIAVSGHGEVQFVDALTGAFTGSFALESEISNALQVAWSYNGRFVAAGSEGKVFVFDALAGTSKTYEVNDEVNFVAWDKDNHLYYDGGQDGVVKDSAYYPQDPLDEPPQPSPISPAAGPAA